MVNVPVQLFSVKPAVPRETVTVQNNPAEAFSQEKSGPEDELIVPTEGANITSKFPPGPPPGIHSSAESTMTFEAPPGFIFPSLSVLRTPVERNLTVEVAVATPADSSSSD
jgi:hypothetical protein